jgi:simple sugar transport system ATP-binding protein
LTPRESEGLFRALKAMAARGMGVIFISHKLGEVLQVTNRITVMRHGAVVSERRNDGGLSKPELARLMCGRELRPPEKPVVDRGEPLFVLDSIRTAANGPRSARRGVYVAARRRNPRIAGVSGNGQGELADLIAGCCDRRAGPSW